MTRFYENLIANLTSYQKTRVSVIKPIISAVIYTTSEQSTGSNIDAAIPISEDTIPVKRPQFSPPDTLSTPSDPSTKSCEQKNTSATSNRNDNNMIIVLIMRIYNLSIQI